MSLCTPFPGVFLANLVLRAMSGPQGIGGLLLLVACLTACAEHAAPVTKPVPLASHPHDVHAFTQGLAWEDGLLFESTGQYGLSRLTVRELASGRILRTTALPPHLFGEGLALVGDEVFQLTWKEGQVRVYDKATLRLKRTLPYDREGWGATWDGRHLIVSDGSAVLRFLDPASLRELRHITVRDAGRPVEALNELEYVAGEILANVYGSDRIVRIDPASGRVIAWLDLSGLYPQAQRPGPEAVLNGIAHDPRRRVLLVTGKYWPRLFVIPVPQRPPGPVDAPPAQGAHATDP